MVLTPFGSEKDSYYMRQALKQAHRASEKNEVPVGAIVVNREGDILARAYNCVEKLKTQIGHAEMRAIHGATKKNNDWRLDGCWLYVTLEPCSMCMGCILLSRIEGLVFGAQSPHFGYRLDMNNALQVYKRDAVRILQGLHAQESVELLKNFFKKQRERA